MNSPPILVAFDLFGTLIRYGIMHHPFRKILKFARENGRKPSPYDARNLMTVDADAEEVMARMEIFPPKKLLDNLVIEIQEELDDLTLFDDAITVLDWLTERGVRLAICSNLANPYGAVINRLLPQYDLVRCLSYEIGAIKPEAKIYDEIVKRSYVNPSEVLFVGDTFTADFAGPAQYGFRALHLQRGGATHQGGIENLSEVIDCVRSMR